MEWARKIGGEKKLSARKSLDARLASNIIIMCSIVVFLFIMGNYNYRSFHTVSELITLFVDFSILIIAINTFGTTENKYFMFLGMAHGFAGMFDLLHVLTMSDLGGFFSYNIDIGYQLWTCSRFIQIIAFLFSCKLFYSDINLIDSFICLLTSSVLLLLSIFYWKVFPKCYTTQNRISSFKMLNEFVIFAIVGFTIYILIKNRKKLDRSVCIYLVLALISIVISEFNLTLLGKPNMLANIIGHVFKVISALFIYKAIVETSLTHPYKLLINRLNTTENELERMHLELEQASINLKNQDREKKLIEENLFRSEVCYDMLIEHSGDCIFAYSYGVIVFANDETARLIGIGNKYNLIGRNIIDFIHPSFRDCTLEKMNEIINGKKDLEGFKTRLIDLNGEFIDVELKSSYFIYKGKPTIINVIKDASALKQIEALRKNVEQSSSMLNSLLEQNKLANEFTANLAHELRTPLNVILGSLQVLDIYREPRSLSDDSQKKDKYLEIIKQNTYRLLRLVNNIIDISKIDAGFFQLQLENNDIINVVENITLSVVPYIESKGVNLIFDTDTEEKIMAFDPDKIERIILNLLSNAIKFTKDGDEIMVSMKDNGDTISVTVSDTGIGIPEDKLETIFERFRQADNQLTKNREGSGIGLSLVKSFVAMHGGTIKAESSIGCGSKFIMEFPVYEIPQDNAAKESNIANSNIERISIEFSDIYSS